MLLSATFLIVIIYTSAFVGKQSYRVHEAIEVFIRTDVRPNHNRSLYSVQLSCTTMRYLFAIGKNPTFHRLTMCYGIYCGHFKPAMPGIPMMEVTNWANDRRPIVNTLVADYRGFTLK